MQIHKPTPKSSENSPVASSKRPTSFIGKAGQWTSSLIGLVASLSVLTQVVLVSLGYDLKGSEGLLTIAIVWGSVATIGFILLFFAEKFGSPTLLSDVALISSFVPPQLPAPNIPEELAKRCAEGNCVLIAGTGLSAQAGYPTWSRLSKDLTDAALKSHVIDKSAEPSLRALRSQKQLDLVIDTVLSAQNGLELASDMLRATYGKPVTDLPKPHRLLAKVPFSAAIGTGFDDLIEKTFGDWGDMSLTSADGEKLFGKLSSRQFFLHRPFGRLDQPTSIVWTLSKLRDVIATDKKYAQFLESLVVSQTLLFLGVSFKGIKDFLECIPGPTGQSSCRHFALVSANDPAWLEKSNELERRFNVRVLPYTPTEGHPQVEAFIKDFLQKVRTETPPANETLMEANKGGVREEKDAVEMPRSGLLRSVTLKNIGPFDMLELALDPHWTILLGDNGVGKSTVLKAIAVGLCGEDATNYAAELIKVRGNHAEQGQTTEVGTIILRTHKSENLYVTTITRTGTRVQVKSVSGRPMEAENWLALGFPPLRTISREKGERQSLQGKRKESHPQDLVPLVRGGPDPRLDQLKGWILALDHASKDESASGPGTYGEVINEFFQVIEELTPGLTIKKGRVNAITEQILIETDDGEIPLEFVSQGTTSLLGWVGIVLQRLSEFYGQNQNRPAVVLIDEIDAHMHPKWQRLIVSSLSKRFPEIQFIGTTHSPLIVPGLDWRQVFIFRRDEKNRKVKVGPAPLTVKRWRADQILTSPLFNLPSTLDPDTHDEIKRYTHLSAKSTLSHNEQVDLEKLGESLNVRLPSTPEREEARLAFEKVEEVLDEKLAAMSIEKKQRVLDEVKVQIQERITDSRRP